MFCAQDNTTYDIRTARVPYKDIVTVVSPPVYPPEPANIPVLRSQIDPAFNMTSTHLDPVAATAEPIPEPSACALDSPSADSSFSDAYKEAPIEMGGNLDEIIKPASDVSDDYAMTFDSDGEEQADSQDISQANIEQETKKPLPVTVSEAAIPSPTSSIEPPTAVPQIGQESPPTQASPPPCHPTTSDAAPTAAKPTDSSANQPPAEPAKVQSHSYEDVANGGIDIQQLLDNITANAEKNESTAISTAQTSNVSLSKAGSSLPSHSSLPPRPNIPQKRPYDDIQKYHAGAPGAPGLPQTPNAYRPPPPPPGLSTSIIAAGAPGTSTDPRSGLPPPPTASFRPPSLSTSSPITPASYTQYNRLSGQGHQTKSIDSLDEVDDIDAKWGPEVQKLYDEFLADERMYVTEGLWDRFPIGSRLFIGNLPSEKVTKRDIFHVFYHYGKLAQISIKQAYGFVQFHDAAACYAALDREQGAEVRGKKINLEISKPQKNTRNAQVSVAAPLRRSRSPDYQRGGMPDRGGRGGQGRNGGDRYDGRSAPTFRSDEYGRPIRIRDDYRPMRSPTPPRGSFQNRDGYARGGRDFYDSRTRRRSRSPSPYGHRDSARYRERSMSPRSRETIEDENLQIPRRDPRNIPDVEIIMMDQLDPAFVSWVENEMRNRGIQVEVMFLNPRMPLQAIIRRQILEGVHAVSKLDLRAQNSSKIPLQVFDRQGGANNVRFDEYQDLEPKIAAELVLRAKQTPPQTQAPNPPYPQPQFAAGQSYQPPAVAAPLPPLPDIASAIGQMDNATLQKLLGTHFATQQQQNTPAVATNSQIDLTSLLGGLKPPVQTQQGYLPQPPASDPYANLAGNSALASLLGNSAPPQQSQPQQSAQQVQNIMAQLARFRQ